MKLVFLSLLFGLILASCGQITNTLSGNSDPGSQPIQNEQNPLTPAENIALGSTVTASISAPGEAPEKAVDGDLVTTWKAGAEPEQWIQIDLGAPTTITEIRLVVYQPYEGQSTHRIWVGDSPVSLKLLHEFNGTTSDNVVLVFPLEIPQTDVRYIRVVTTKSPGFVAWREIQIKGNPVEIAATPIIFSEADTIFFNGTILTMEKNNQTADAIAIKGDSILAVGSLAEVSAYQGDSTRLVDLDGLTMTPGFIDSHEHRIGDRWQYADPPPPVSRVFYEIMKEGWTSIHELWVDSGRLNEFINLNSIGQLPVRVSLYLKMNSEYTIDNWWQTYQPLTSYSPYLQIAGLKITLDREWGQMIFVNNQQDLNALVLSGTSRGWQVATHSFTPQANQLILNAYENALNGGSNDTLRLRLEHIGVITDDEIQQMARTHILGSVQLIGTGALVDDASFKTEIPASQVQLTSPWRDLINAGVYLLGNTDAPWCCTDWRHNLRGSGNIPTIAQAIYQGVTRTTFNNRPPEAWQIAQAVTVQEALEMMTIRGAYAAHQDNVTGSLTAGKFADLVILSANPLTTPISQIPTIVVVKTMIGGKTGYCASGYEAVCTATSSP